MAGIEHIQVHSKSYLVRWIQVSEHHSISWSLQPNKKSVNFGIFKHPGTKNGLNPNLPAQETIESAANTPGTPAPDGASQSRPQQASRRASVTDSNVVEKLQGIGLRSVAWTGRCEADKVAMGRYDVPEGEGGTYGLVFDNTFSKQTSKTVTFVLMTHPTHAPPKSGHHLHYAMANASSGSNVGSRRGSSPSLKPVSESSDSLPLHAHRAVLEDPRPNSKGGHPVESRGIEGATFYTGVLWKKRRKRGQAPAKRFFSLDFTSSTLSYYKNRHSSALRGAIPLSLAAVGANEKNREFSVDSGAEVWHLKAINRKDFESWRDALQRAQANAYTPSTPSKVLRDFPLPKRQDPAEEREWQRVEQLVSKVAGTRDAVRGLAKDTDSKYSTGSNGAGLGLTTLESSSNNASPISNEDANSYFLQPDDRSNAQRRPFWKRTASADRSPSALFRRSVSAQLAFPSPSLAGPASPSNGSITIPKRPSMSTIQQSPLRGSSEVDVHERCMALLRDLDSVVSDFSALVAESKARRQPPQLTTNSRLSLDSIDDQEFFDADDGGTPSHLLDIRRSSEYTEPQGDLFDEGSDVDSDSSSDAGDGPGESVIFSPKRQTSQSPLFPDKPQTLSPLPLSPVKRRTTVKPPKQAPPSIIGFLRKNAGKDLSTVSMPVTANEPTSLLQRLAETLEYPQLLDAAASTSISAAERMMYVAAFAVSYYSNNRVKERAIRKPFNPMLGETFELVREDLGFRFLAEKVSHHPVRMACQAESLNNGGWCYTQSPQPVQKFWGKSVELNNDGRARVVVHASQEHYSWTQATCFLRNVIAGEKYVEPVQTMTVSNETNGMRAVATFKSGGMFSGRSEDVSVQLFDKDSPLPLGLSGKWTESLNRTDTGATVWKVGPLVPDAAKVYGFTSFAAALNEVTQVEEGHLPPTDSRLRPDQQALEEGDADKAEALKARLEERQRARRKVLESHGQEWKPQFFEKVPTNVVDDQSEEVWVLKSDKAGYWQKRAAGDWSGVQQVFEL
ncbi:Oxysterol-binding [Fulvia fulva]|uniref:Oxysterol-binding n=1 Tax=Passalora fulva TaxID=5499 RepID=A0A9Q8PIK8_PASFU|nr:Oxysterol-binding [Fulvia fulva]KAK4626156.1 Oxysterol-binding [Fulvia fulva]KAK4627507.1 Oxysterol-binding [Fulvia fulva]UJO23160.1 Oxysterol-binding [Fulvia fulva]WPV13808.1 Oxysterol-binding [Fulvia fulva]WPV29009.1 Oxysterol-binding [Fulvia fulva]